MPSGGWLVELVRRRDARVRLVCLPPAGGNAAMFAGLTAGLPEWIEVYAVQLPGRRERAQEPPVRRLSQVLPPLVGELAGSGPLVLFGNSLGATLAFELARRLQRRGDQVMRLLVSSARAPHVAGRMPAYSAMPDQEFTVALASLGALPPEAAEHPELPAALLPTLRADFELGETYRFRPGPALTCPVDAVTGADDVHVPDELAAAWADLTDAAFTHTVVPGGHDLLARCPERFRTALLKACAGVAA